MGLSAPLKHLYRMRKFGFSLKIPTIFRKTNEYQEPTAPITNYQQIPGWFDYESIYDRNIPLLVQRLDRKPVVVEIGAWLGKSSFYLTENHHQHADIYIVDTWQGTPESLDGSHKLATERDIFVDFMRNMRAHHGKFTPLRAHSVDAARYFDDNSIDLIFIDADHSYEGAKADIEAWLPKLSAQGIIAGHDYTSSWPGVKRAVKEQFDQAVKKQGQSWIHDRGLVSA